MQVEWYHPRTKPVPVPFEPVVEDGFDSFVSEDDVEDIMEEQGAELFFEEELIAS